MKTLKYQLESSDFLYNQLWRRFQKLSTITYISMLNDSTYVQIDYKPHHVTNVPEIKVSFCNLFSEQSITFTDVKVDIDELEILNFYDEVKNLMEGGYWYGLNK